MKEWVLITGASSGIGLALAKRFAMAGDNVALVARDAARLSSISADLSSKYGVQVMTLVKDLASLSVPAEIFEEMHRIPVSILVNNAGVGAFGTFVETDLKTQLQVMNVNMTALVQLTHLFLEPMISRKAGRVLNMASIAAFQPGPSKAIYYATKSFVYSFSYALSDELSGTGITVTTVCPGATNTAFHDRAGMKPTLARFGVMQPDAVANAAYLGLVKGRRVVIPGTFNKLVSLATRCTPTSLTASVVRKLNRK